MATTPTVLRRKRNWPLWLVFILGICLLGGLAWFVYDRLTFQPSGEIAYECYPDICIINADGSNQRVLVDLPGPISSPIWSPDGRHLAFTDNGNLHLVKPDGTDLKKITNMTESQEVTNGFIVWSPNGREILVQAKVSNINGLFSVEVDIENSPLQLIVEREFSSYSPYRSVFSQDGSFLYHAINLGPSSARTAITRLDDLSTQILDFLCAGASLTPNNNELSCSGQKGIEIYDLYQGKNRLLSNWSTQLSGANSPSWSPDGQYIVYSQTFWPGFMGNYNGELWIMNADGSHPVKLTNGPNDRNPAWRPQP